MSTTDPQPPFASPEPAVSEAAALEPAVSEPIGSQARTLRRLFLTLFLRGHAGRRLHRQRAPKSVAEKLALTLTFYALFGCVALFFRQQSVFALAIYLHAMTLAFLGMFIASSAGEILFNKEEADILLHRPVSPQAMLWAKIRVLVEVSLWLAGAFNLAGLAVGFGSAGNWRFPVVHLFSTALEAMFCTGCVVLAYQLCLRWFGRERLEGLMTAAQVLVSVAVVLSGQILPRIVLHLGHVYNVTESAWWIGLLPPAWFAGLDDALAGSATRASWQLAGLAVTVTILVLWIAFGKLAHDYETGLQALNETISPRVAKANGCRRLGRLVNLPPLRWWLRDPVARASFLLTAAYLVRDRDVKLRVYPGLAPMLILPFVFLFRSNPGHAAPDISFGVPFAGVFLGMVPLLGLQILQYSQQWQAADIFRAAPLSGPGRICHGARQAVLCLLAVPMFVLVGLIIWMLRGDLSQLILFLPGIIALPVFSLLPSIGGKGVPLSLPTDAAKAAGRGLSMSLVMMVAFALAGLTTWAWSQGWFWWLLMGETMVAGGIYFALRAVLAKARWPASE